MFGSSVTAEVRRQLAGATLSTPDAESSGGAADPSRPHRAMLGMTYSEFSAGSATTQRPALRKEYLAALQGESIDGGPIEGLYSIGRQVRDGPLIKFVQRTPDGLETESVIIPMWRKGRRWTTLCVSSQVGCAMGCTFCETAQLGRLRNLTAAEIVGQVVAARRLCDTAARHCGTAVLGCDAPLTNVVFMGMGEPFDNFDEVIQAVRVLTDPMGLSFGMSRITISTVGRVEGIRRLAALGWRRVNLAVSLNAPNDEIRSRIMPINRAESMDELRRALLDYPLRRCQFLMIEYVLIPGVNDAADHARQVAEYLRGIKCCVNVIPYNPRLNSPWPAPGEESVQRFLGRLQDAGQFCKKRITKGREYMAACGQLGNRALKNLPATASERREHA